MPHAGLGRWEECLQDVQTVIEVTPTIPSLCHHITAPSPHHHRTITAPGKQRICDRCVEATIEMTITAPSLPRHCTITAPSLSPSRHPGQCMLSPRLLGTFASLHHHCTTTQPHPRHHHISGLITTSSLLLLNVFYGTSGIFRCCYAGQTLHH